MVILGVETSCDETAAAVLKDGVCLGDLIASQVDLHKRYGGVVPELACRRHVEVLAPLVQETLQKAGCGLEALQAIAVTAGPGLIGALLVGASFAKSLAYALHIPLIPVHHLEGHIASVFIEHDTIAFPAVALVVSGGHTSLYALARRGAYWTRGRGCWVTIIQGVR
jgi:N6-L-threonylcarbamoyladenine synthase